MAKKKGNLGAALSLLSDPEMQKEMNEVYNKLPGSKTTKKEEGSQKEERKKEEVATSAKEAPDSSEPRHPEPEQKKQPVQKRSKNIDKPEYTTIRVDKTKKKAIELFVMSEAFDGVKNDTDMLDYIIQYFMERKAHKELLEPFKAMLKL